MKPSIKRARLLDLLTEGPATSAELAAETGWTPTLISAHLCLLRRQGRVRSEVFSTGQWRSLLWHRTEGTCA